MIGWKAIELKEVIEVKFNRLFGSSAEVTNISERPMKTTYIVKVNGKGYIKLQFCDGIRTMTVYDNRGIVAEVNPQFTVNNDNLDETILEELYELYFNSIPIMVN